MGTEAQYSAVRCFVCWAKDPEPLEFKRRSLSLVPVLSGRSSDASGGTVGCGAQVSKTRVVTAKVFGHQISKFYRHWNVTDCGCCGGGGPDRGAFKTHFLYVRIRVPKS